MDDRVEWKSLAQGNDTLNILMVALFIIFGLVASFGWAYSQGWFF